MKTRRMQRKRERTWRIPAPVAPAPTTSEPEGLELLTTLQFTGELPAPGGDDPIAGAPGWAVVFNAAVDDPNGWAVRADHDGRSVCDFVYPAGMVEGTAPATVYWGVINADEVYVRFWWKPTTPFDLGPNGTKLLHLLNGADGKHFLILRPDGKLHVVPEYAGSDFAWRSPLAAVPVVTLGQAHIVEWRADRVTGEGSVHLDGVLHLSYEGVVSAQAFEYFYMSPTFGGNSGAVKTRTDHFYFDDISISARTA
jgi:hypothetical protein